MTKVLAQSKLRGCSSGRCKPQQTLARPKPFSQKESLNCSSYSNNCLGRRSDDLQAQQVVPSVRSSCDIDSSLRKASWDHTGKLNVHTNTDCAWGHRASQSSPDNRAQTK